jgi:hypothetical protein
MVEEFRSDLIKVNIIIQVLSESFFSSNSDKNVLTLWHSIVNIFKNISDNAYANLHELLLKISDSIVDLLSRNDFEKCVVELNKLKILVKYLNDLQINSVNTDCIVVYSNSKEKIYNKILNLFNDSIDALEISVAAKNNNNFKDSDKFSLYCSNIELVTFTMNLSDLSEHFDVIEMNKKFISLKKLVEKYLETLKNSVFAICVEKEKQVLRNNVDFSTIIHMISMIKTLLKLNVMSVLKEKIEKEISNYTFTVSKNIHHSVVVCFNQFSNNDFLSGKQTDVFNAKLQFSYGLYNLFKSRVFNDKCDFFSDLIECMNSDVTKHFNIDDIIQFNMNQHQKLFDYALLNRKAAILHYSLSKEVEVGCVDVVEQLKKTLLDFN